MKAEVWEVQHAHLAKVHLFESSEPSSKSWGLFNTSAMNLYFTLWAQQILVHTLAKQWKPESFAFFFCQKNGHFLARFCWDHFSWDPILRESNLMQMYRKFWQSSLVYNSTSALFGLVIWWPPVWEEQKKDAEMIGLVSQKPLVSRFVFKTTQNRNPKGIGA